MNRDQASQILLNGGMVKHLGLSGQLFYFKIVGDKLSVTLQDPLINRDALFIDGFYFNAIDSFELHEEVKESTDLSEKYKTAVASLKYYADGNSWHDQVAANKYACIYNVDLGDGEFVLNTSLRLNDKNVGGLLARQTLKDLGEL